MKTKEATTLNHFLINISKDCKGKLGYAIARNIRILNTELTEYNNIRNELIQKYGKVVDQSIVIENGSKEYDDFINEMKQYDDIDIEVNLTKVSKEILEESNLSADILVTLMEYMEEL